MNRIVVLAVAMTTMLSGCAASRPQSFPRGVVDTIVGGVNPVLVPTGRIVRRGEAMTSEGDGHAIVILVQGDSARNARACHVMAQAVNIRSGSADGRPESVDSIQVYERPIYWPVMTTTALTCPAMLNNYDYTRAFAQLQQVRNPASLGRGPFVVLRRKTGASAGLFDFSSVAPQDFDEHFAEVVRYLKQRSEFWTDADKEATIRQRLRNLILVRGGGAAEAIYSWFPAAGR